MANFTLSNKIYQHIQTKTETGIVCAVPVLRSKDWKSFRFRLVERHPFCALCKKNKLLEAHHIYPYHLYPELELEESNIIILCETHHFLFGHLLDWKAFNPEVVKDVILFSEKINSRFYDRLTL